MMITTEFFDEWYPEFPVVFKLSEFVRIDYVTYIASNHVFPQMPNIRISDKIPAKPAFCQAAGICYACRWAI
jgi:hypothetical protein